MSNTSSTTAYAPAFSPEAWNKVDLDGANCYQYAFAGSLPDGSNHVYSEAFPMPGDFSGKTGLRPQDSEANLANALRLDGIQILSKENLPPSMPGNYVVGIYLHEGADFHFVRMDRDGGWSDKYGVGSPVERFIKPSDDGTPQPLPPRFGLTDYYLVGYAYAPEAGINLGPEKAIVASLKTQPDGASLQDFIGRTDPAYLKMLGQTIAQYYPTDVADQFDKTVQHYSAPPAVVDKAPQR